MFLNLKDIILLLHPILACTFVFPVIGITTFLALQTRQRRLKDTTSIPATVGHLHVKLGKLLAAGVVGITLVALAYSVVFGFQGFLMQAENNALQPLSVVLVVLMFVVTIAATVFLYRAQSKIWRGVFALLSGMGVTILAFQPGVFRRDDEWWISHFYFGLASVMLMIFSVAIVHDIYQDRSLRWRRIHMGLNALVLVLFLLQGITGTRDLLEIPLSWQAPVVYQCNFDPRSPQFKTCP
ncbi:MAG: DUF4079 domain-containing protein [Thermosynechococcus sp. Uc]|uniref:DUF4079 domain-containing protein n=1 Tax=Thermosynechococcus sp. Uc TaxID=3034853 RepID=UPI0019E35159|nr:DUF4079 domain-containing protein [Thermosynechococcus sp. Uc]MDM7326194.1 DUF4079 domain-containing protein [Thermosynechococcus sp. Uc]HIK25282.1 DUF4079 domain-containing protein [Thermosynechococcus sp. M46_R2017_013]